MNIIDIPAGGKVSEPGLYKMSMEDYHSVGVCPGPSVSSTGIRTAHKSPHAFWKTSRLKPERITVLTVGKDHRVERDRQRLLLCPFLNINHRMPPFEIGQYLEFSPGPTKQKWPLIRR
jgi:hypothetical protein